MPLPENPEAYRAFLHFIAKGDPNAIEYLDIVTRMVYWADDIVDEPLTERQRQDNASRLLWAAMVDLPRNRFHQRYAAELAPLLGDVIVAWKKSDEWRQSGDAKRETFGFVRRENMDGLAGAVAGIVGGMDHAAAVAEAIMDVCHATPETVAEWVSE